MTVKAPGAAIFDMDGTLLDSERPLMEAMRAAAEAMGRAELEPALRAVIGLREELAADSLTAAFGGRADYEAFSRQVRSHLAEAGAQPIMLKPYAHDALRQLHEAGVPLVVATSTDTGQATRLLDAAGLLGFLDHVIGGDMVARPKPYPEIYEAAAAALGLPPAACAAFEDSAPGTRAALAAGCRTFQIPDLAPPDAALRALGHMISADLRQAVLAAGFSIQL